MVALSSAGFGIATWLTEAVSGLGALLSGAAFGVFFAGFMTGWLALQRRRDNAATGNAPSPDRVELARAVRTGEPPADHALDPAVLRLVDRRRVQIRRAKRAFPWVFGTITLAGLVNAVSTHSVVQYAMVALLVAVAVSSWMSSGRGLARMDRLEAAIRERSAA
jgi:hypothetical protein